MQKMIRLLKDKLVIAPWVWFQRSKDGNEVPHQSVFVVSDDHFTLSLIDHALSKYEYNFYPAMGVNDALQVLERIPIPDVMICDFVRPEEDGEGFLKTVGIRFGKPALPPLIFLMDTQEDEIAARALGANELLLKPLEPQALLDCINRLVSDGSSE